MKWPIVFGLGVYAAAEFNFDLNRSLRAPQIFGGEAAKGQAQIDDPTQTRKDMAAGRPVTGADALVGTEVDMGNADARTQGAKAVAANESIEEIEAKKTRGEKLSVTERLQWLDVQIAGQDVVIKGTEARAKAAEARMKEAEASAADAHDVEGLSLTLSRPDHARSGWLLIDWIEKGYFARLVYPADTG